LIFGIFGACRREEITNLMRRDVQDKGEFIWITLPNTKTKITREFAITDGNIQGISCLDLFRKYMDLRPSQTKHDRFFLTYRGGKCTQQPVGVNTIGGIPKKIATALGLSEPANYTGHCFRRSSASLLADAGADMHTLKRHGGWKSDNVAEGYVETSVQNKKIIATKIMGSSDTLRSTSNVMVEKPSINLGTASGVNIENVSNCVIYVNK
jgi:integrase